MLVGEVHNYLINKNFEYEEDFDEIMSSECFYYFKDGFGIEIFFTYDKKITKSNFKKIKIDSIIIHDTQEFSYNDYDDTIKLSSDKELNLFKYIILILTDSFELYNFNMLYEFEKLKFSNEIKEKFLPILQAYNCYFEIKKKEITYENTRYAFTPPSFDKNIVCFNLELFTWKKTIEFYELGAHDFDIDLIKFETNISNIDKQYKDKIEKYKTNLGFNI